MPILQTSNTILCNMTDGERVASTTEHAGPLRAVSSSDKSVSLELQGSPGVAQKLQRRVQLGTGMSA